MIILHGDNQVGSRQQLTSLKQAALLAKKALVSLDQETEIDQVIQASEANSLFGEANCVVVENLFSARPSKSRQTIVDYLIRHQSADIILWDSKDISAKLTGFNSQIVRRYDLPKYVFKFLDDFSPTALQQALTSAAPEQILALVAGQLRKLIMVKTKSGTWPAWQQTKLASQAAKYTLEQLGQYNLQLLQMDYAQKTSAAPYGLEAALELWVAGL
ncbi:MAG: hypothetical protein Q7S31_02105 [bacterium]|nr:hypothetical protein [bacterium]